MPTAVPLSQLVDLALGTPEVGAVNFNILHTLLHAMITKLGLEDLKAEVNDQDRDFLATIVPKSGGKGIAGGFKETSGKDGLDTTGDKDSAVSFPRVGSAGGWDDSVRGDDSVLDDGSEVSFIPNKTSTYHRLENRVAELSKVLSELNALPTTTALLNEVKGKTTSEKPVADMWQNMQLKKRVDANEEGVGKLMQMVEDLMKELEQQKEENRKLADLVNKFDADDFLKRLEALEKMTDALRNDLDNGMADLKNLADKFAYYPSLEDFAQFMRWSDLEDALKGIRAELENMGQKRVVNVIEVSSQTEKVESRPVSAASRSSRPGSSRSGPSVELLDILETLGNISNNHMQLEKRVSDLEERFTGLENRPVPEIPAETTSGEEMKNKVDKDDLKNLGNTDELLNELKNLRNDMQNLQETVAQMEMGNLSPGPQDSKTICTSPSPPLVSQDLHPSPPQGLHPSLPHSNSLTRSQSELNQTAEVQSAGNDSQSHNKPEPDKPSNGNQLEAGSLQLKGMAGVDAELRKELEELMKKIKEDAEALARLQQMLTLLEAAIDRLNNTTRELAQDGLNKDTKIEELFNLCNGLEKKKADKEYVAMEVDVKADKKQLEGKVNHHLFDSTTSEINKTIKEILDQLAGNTGDWKSMLAKLTNDLDGKLDRLELNPLKDWLEKKLKALSKKMQEGKLQWTEDDAAGLKRQLIQHYHCLSCDKPMNVMPSGPQPSVNAGYGMPSSRSPRPYTTFELDQIRQHAKSFGSPDQADFYASSRQCGGSHTLTLPHQRFTRLNTFKKSKKEKLENASHLYRDDEEAEEVIPIHKEEVDVMGADGHIYRGRMDRTERLEAKMPVRMSRSPATNRQNAAQDQQPRTSHSQRPTSARGQKPTTPPLRHSSSRGSRPQSARIPPKSDMTDQQSGLTTPPPDEPRVDIQEDGEINVEMPRDTAQDE